MGKVDPYRTAGLHSWEFECQCRLVRLIRFKKQLSDQPYRLRRATG